MADSMAYLKEDLLTLGKYFNCPWGLIFTIFLGYTFETQMELKHH